MLIYRLCKARHASHAFDGEGARRFGSRWNPVGTPVVHCAGSLSLAALEALTGFGRREAPADYVCIEVEVPDGLEIEWIPAADLPADWRTYPAPEALAEIGRDWVMSGRTGVLSVPSAVIPSEWNYILNPAHPDFRRLRKGRPKPFALDPRLL